VPKHSDGESTFDVPLASSDSFAGTLAVSALFAALDRRAIQSALLACDGNGRKTAERLGIGCGHLVEKIREYDVRP
jgi:DNA-binding NtrC family response regulator